MFPSVDTARPDWRAQCKFRLTFWFAENDPEGVAFEYPVANRFANKLHGIE
jgi:hypothetical protein